jgi:hypothetical protein
MLAHLVARAAARLKVRVGAGFDDDARGKESDQSDPEQQQQRRDARLASAAAAAAKGDLAAAADALTAAARGTAAAPYVAAWVADARARAASEQTLKLLRAHATTVTTAAVAAAPQDA